MKRLNAMLCEQQTETEKLDTTVAANLPVRRNTNEGGKEFGYGG